MNKRKIYLITVAAVCILLASLLCAAAVSICMEGLARKAEDPLAAIYTPEIVAEKLRLIAPLFAVFILLLPAGLLPGIREKRKDRPAGRDLPYHAGGTGSPDAAGKKKAFQAAIVVIAAALIIAGIFNGSARDVLIKAITICTECIGLG